MRTILTAMALVVLLPALVCAYEVGGKAKSNFNSQAAAQTADQNNNPATPATRSFTSYGSRWSKGVQTQGVETHLAGENVTTFKPVPTTVGKVAVNNAAQPASTPAAPTQASTQTAAGAAGAAQSAAAIQQLQGIQDIVKTMGGAQAAAGAQPAAGGAAGMPDFSAILNSAGAAAAGGGGKPK